MKIATIVLAIAFAGVFAQAQSILGVRSKDRIVTTSLIHAKPTASYRAPCQLLGSGLFLSHALPGRFFAPP